MLAEANWSCVPGRVDAAAGRGERGLPPLRVAASTPLILPHATHLMLISWCMAGFPSLRPSWLTLSSQPFFFFFPYERKWNVSCCWKWRILQLQFAVSKRIKPQEEPWKRCIGGLIIGRRCYVVQFSLPRWVSRGSWEEVCKFVTCWLSLSVKTVYFQAEVVNIQHQYYFSAGPPTSNICTNENLCGLVRTLIGFSPLSYLNLADLMQLARDPIESFHIPLSGWEAPRVYQRQGHQHVTRRSMWKSVKWCYTVISSCILSLAPPRVKGHRAWRLAAPPTPPSDLINEGQWQRWQRFSFH